MPSPYPFLNLSAKGVRAATSASERLNRVDLRELGRVRRSPIAPPASGRFLEQPEESAERFGLEQIVPFLDEVFGDVPKLYLGRVRGEPVLVSQTAGWRNKFETIGFKFLGTDEAGDQVFRFPVDPLLETRPFLAG